MSFFSSSRRLIKITLSLVAASTLVFALFLRSDSSIDVAITQIAPHPSLDKIEQGIIDTLVKAGIQRERILSQNAQGSPSNALQIARKFVSLKPKIIVPITTPSTQAVYGLTKNAEIPVIFSAISDPIAARLDPSKEKLLAGVSDRSPIKEQLALIQEILPGAKRIGILYNAGEANSVSLVGELEAQAKALGIFIARATVTSTGQVTDAVLSLVGKVDALYVPNDNMVISAFDSVLRVANQHRMPIFTADPESVQRGALASIAHDQYHIGAVTGKMVLEYLSGDSLIKDLGVRTPQKIILSLNKKTADALGIYISQKTLQNINILVK